MLALAKPQVHRSTTQVTILTVYSGNVATVSAKGPSCWRYILSAHQDLLMSTHQGQVEDDYTITEQADFRRGLVVDIYH